MQSCRSSVLRIIKCISLFNIQRLILQNATAWRCFTFSKHPIAITAEGTQLAAHTTQVSSPSVMNHVMHASYGEVSFQNQCIQ